MWALGARGALGRYPEGLSARALGTRGELGRHPEGLSARALGTRGELGRYPEGSLGVGFRDTWHTRKAPGVILPVGALGTRGVPGMLPGVILPVGALGHVAYPESARI